MVVPSATVFFSSGCLVVLELVASRLVARELGSSVYTWTAIVSVVLAGLALGLYGGGRIADRCHARRALAVVFGLASAACVATVVLDNLLGHWLGLWRLGWPGHVLVHVGIIFPLPAALLGAIGPIAVKMALERGLPAGRATGAVYAWAAAGGAVGVLLTGFLLIPALGSATLLWLLGAALLAVAVLYWISCWAMYLWAMVFVALATAGMSGDTWAQEAGAAAFLREGPDPNLVYLDERPSGRLVVRRVSRRPDTRVFLQDNYARSEVVMGDAVHLRQFHAKVYAGLTQGLSGDGRNLAFMVLGAGGYVFPRYLKACWPDSALDVVETDTGAAKAGEAALGFQRHPAIKIVVEEARRYVNLLAAGGRAGESGKRYDFVYNDAPGAGAVPPPLTTWEFYERIAGLLAEEGVYLTHLRDVCQAGRLVGAVVNTAREVLPYVYVIADRPSRTWGNATFVVVAAKRPLDPRAILQEHRAHLEFRVLDESEIRSLRERGGAVLTDDYAPVETLRAPAVRQGAQEELARRYIQKAEDLQDEYQYDQSIRWYERAWEADPSVAVEAYEQIGLLSVARSRPEAAVESFRRAIEAHARTGEGRSVIGSVHMNLGLLLGRAGKFEEAKAHRLEAVKWFRSELEDDPSAVVLWESLGDTCAALGDFPGASDAFGRAAALEPQSPSHYEKLARALERQHRYDEAVATVRKHVKLMREQGRRDVATQLDQYIEVLEWKKLKQRK
jgi:tetratricopeptide (TPR) repeat protein/MFS family permease